MMINEGKTMIMVDCGSGHFSHQQKIFTSVTPKGVDSSKEKVAA